jgi:two-component system phosphate regulon sensor histidine kinase PhoR
LILGYIETLKTGAIKGGESLGRCLDIMDKHSRRLMHVIDDINAVAQLEPDSSPTPCDDVFMRRSLETAYESLMPLVELTGCSVTSRIPAGSCHLKGARTVWHLVFSKLLEEVLRGVPARSSIDLQVSWEPLGCCLEVRTDAPMVTRGAASPGAGDWTQAALGLLVVKRAMELNHGTLEWITLPEGGTLFRLSLPCVDCCASKDCAVTVSKTPSCS